MITKTGLHIDILRENVTDEHRPKIIGAVIWREWYLDPGGNKVMDPNAVNVEIVGGDIEAVIDQLRHIESLMEEKSV